MNVVYVKDPFANPKKYAVLIVKKCFVKTALFIFYKNKDYVHIKFV